MTDSRMETLAAVIPDRTGIATLLTAEVRAHSLFQVTSAQVAGLRKLTSASEGRKSGSQMTLRYSDEQTIAATHAVLAAIEKMGQRPPSFENWGVLAATRYLGRSGLANALQVFRKEGVWGVSPHLIPHFALHSASGTLSLTLGIHGPNLGIGGGTHAATEGFLTALTWISAGIVPGVWLVLTGWTPEFVPGISDTPASDAHCSALALALSNLPQDTESPSPYQGISVNVVTSQPPTISEAPLNLVTLAKLLDQPQQLDVPRIIASNPDGSYGVELSFAGRDARSAR